MQDIYKKRETVRKYKPVSEFPAVSRDISLAVRPNITADDIEQAIYSAIKDEKQVVLADLRFIEKYEG